MNLILPDNLARVWERVRAGLLEVQKHSVEDWIPEDVYMALKTGQAALYMHDRAFLIAQLLPTYHGKRLHVWCAYNDGKPGLRIFLRHLKALAVEAGASKITFMSPRDEWLSVGKRGGFRPTQTTFELEVTL